MRTYKSTEAERAYRRDYYRRNREKVLAWHKEDYKANADARKAVSADYRKKNPTAQYSHRIKRLYGMTQAEYDAMRDAQGGVCAICKQPPTASTGTAIGPGKLHVDHDHETGAVRSLLCQKCNRGLGCFGDDVNLLLRAGMYLRLHAVKKSRAAV